MRCLRAGYSWRKGELAIAGYSARTRSSSAGFLSHAPLPHRVKRLSATALEIETVGGRFADSVSEQVVRTPRRPFRVGETIALDGAQVTVLAVDGALATRIRLELDEPLDAPDARIIAWRGGALRRVELPSVGAILDLPKTPGVLELASQY